MLPEGEVGGNTILTVVEESDATYDVRCAIFIYPRSCFKSGDLLLVVVVAGTGLANVELVVANVLEDLHDESLTLGLESLEVSGLGLGVLGGVGLDVSLDGLDES